MFNKKLLFFILLICLICPLSLGITNLTVTEKGSSYIIWHWNGTATNVSVDGLKVIYADLLSNNFTLSDVNDNETHTFCAYSVNAFQCNSTSTYLPVKTSSEKITDFALLYLWVFLTIGLLIGSVWIRPLALLGFIFSLIGILQSLNGSFYTALIFGVTAIIAAISIRYD